MLILFLILVLSGLLLIWMAVIERRAFQINRYPVTIRKPLKRPLRILHLSDTHFASPWPALDRFFDRLAKESFDFVFITGDIIDCDAGISSCVENLGKLKPAKGSFVVFGNHDYYDYYLSDVITHSVPGHGKPQKKNQPDLLQQALEKGGIRVLKNETVEVEWQDQSILIHGLDDPITGRANIRRTLQNFHPQKLNILLTHTIDVFIDIGDDEIDLSFSGHSHGGQICLPFVGPIVCHTLLGRNYAKGIKTFKGSICSISRGIGTSRFFGFRLLARPEAILLTVSGSGDGPHASGAGICPGRS